MFATGQRANIKCCVLLHKSPAETVIMLEEEYSKETMNKNAVYPMAVRMSMTFSDARCR
jgi:hypothetical protein